MGKTIVECVTRTLFAFPVLLICLACGPGLAQAKPPSESDASAADSYDLAHRTQPDDDNDSADDKEEEASKDDISPEEQMRQLAETAEDFLLAAQGDASALWRLGYDYAVGYGGLPKDPVLAESYMLKAAEKGDSSAADWLAHLYRQKGDFSEAARWQRAAAEMNNDCTFALGQLYEQGEKGLPRDMDKALACYRHDASRNDASSDSRLQSTLRLFVLYDRGESVPKDDVEAAHWLYQAALGDNNVAARYLLGMRFKEGKGVPKDSARAAFWLRKSRTEQAHAILGQMYLDGDGVTKDRFEAYVRFSAANIYLYQIRRQEEQIVDDLPSVNVKAALKALEESMSPAERSEARSRFAAWEYAIDEKRSGICSSDAIEPAALARLTRRAERNNAESQFWLADYYQCQGEPDKALFWYQKAAHQGFLQAQWALTGNVFGEIKRDGKPLYWEQKAAEGGYAEARFRLGERYEKGDGVSRDMEKAIAWYEGAAEHYHAKAMTRLGRFYLADGPQHDPVRAVFWLTEAIWRKDNAGAALLSDCSLHGWGVPVDPVMAAMWLERSIVRTDSADEKKRLAALMETLSAEQKEQVKKLSREWWAL